MAEGGELVDLDDASNRATEPHDQAPFRPVHGHLMPSWTPRLSCAAQLQMLEPAARVSSYWHRWGECTDAYRGFCNASIATAKFNAISVSVM
jgi:hypothetical protein